MLVSTMDSHQGGMAQGHEGTCLRCFSTDVLLFGSLLVHHYRVFGRSAAHASLRGKFMAKLRKFTVQAESEARWESNRVPIQRNQFPTISDTLCSIRPQDTDNEYPLCKSRRVLSPVVPEVSADTVPSTSASSVKLSTGAAASYVLPAPRPRSLLYDGQPPVVPVSLELSRFADKDFMQSRIQCVVVATQPYPSSPE